MKNPATHINKDDFNEFTDYLYLATVEFNRRPLVRLRNGTMANVERYSDEGPAYEGFRSVSRHPWLIWDNDGTCITSRDFDMMETIHD